MGKSSRMCNMEVICNIAVAACITRTKMHLCLFLCAVLPENSLDIKYVITTFRVEEEN